MPGCTELPPHACYSYWQQYDVMGQEAKLECSEGPREPTLSVETLWNLADTLLPASLLLSLAQLSSLNYPPFFQLYYPVLSLLCTSPTAGINLCWKVFLTHSRLFVEHQLSAQGRGKNIYIYRAPALIELNC